MTQSETPQHETPHITVRFGFDPLCPWAWRTSLWMREVATVRPVIIAWDFFSLYWANQANNPADTRPFTSAMSFRIMALLRHQHAERDANTSIDRLYRAFGMAAHERHEPLDDHDILERALTEAQLPASLLAQAEAAPTLLDDVRSSHDALVALGAFGVPALVLSSDSYEYPLNAVFGPVIDRVPQGEDAGVLWDHVEGLVRRHDFFELKRSR